MAWKVVSTPGAQPAAPTGRWRVVSRPGEIAGTGTATGTVDANTPMRFVSQALSGANEGLANVLGAPGDLLDAGLGAVGIGPVFNSSDTFKSGLSAVGAIGDAPNSGAERMVRRVGAEVGSSVIPAAGLATYALRAPMVASGASGIINSMVGGAQAAPLATAAGQIGGSVASGLGAGIAREIDPRFEALGQVIGGFAPAMGAMATRGAMRGGETGRKAFSDTVDTFATAGTTPTVGQAAGSKALMGTEGILRNLPAASGRMYSTAEKQGEAMAAKMGEIGKAAAPYATGEAAGRAVSKGVDTWVAGFRNRASGLYNTVDQALPPTTPVELTNTTRALGELTAIDPGAARTTAGLVNPKARAIAEDLAADLGGGTALPYSAMKSLRSKVGRMMTDTSLVSDIPRAEIKKIWGALTEDINASAQALSPAAAKALGRANAFYKAGSDRIDDYLDRLSAKADPDQVFNALYNARGGSSFIRAVTRSMPDAERRTLAGAMVQKLWGDDTTPATFLSAYKKISDPAKDALFSGAAMGTMRRDLDAVAAAAERIGEASRYFSNPSGTAKNVITGGVGIEAAKALANSDVWTLSYIMAGLASTRGAAQLMTSPKFVRWLALSTKIKPENVTSWVGRLANVGKDDPAIAEEAAQLQQTLRASQP